MNQKKDKLFMHKVQNNEIQIKNKQKISKK